MHRIRERRPWVVTALKRDNRVEYSRTVFLYIDGVSQVFAFSVPADVQATVMSVDVHAFIHSKLL